MKALHDYINNRYGLMITRQQIVMVIFLSCIVVIGVGYLMMRDTLRAESIDAPITPPTRYAPLFEKK